MTLSSVAKSAASQQVARDLEIRDERASLLTQRAVMHRQRGTASSSRVESASDNARTTNLVQELARNLITPRRRGQHEAGVIPSQEKVNKAMKLCIMILTSHIGEPLMATDEASVVQAIRTRLVKVIEDLIVSHVSPSAFVFGVVHAADALRCAQGTQRMWHRGLSRCRRVMRGAA